MSLRHRYAENGLTSAGRRIPDLPVVKLMLLRRDVKLRATGLAIIDTGFDGGVLPNIQLLTFFEGSTPRYIEKLAGPLGGTVDCEVFEVEGSLLSEDRKSALRLGKLNAYIPVEPEYLSNEVLLGREVLNTLGIRLNGKLADIVQPG